MTRSSRTTVLARLRAMLDAMLDAAQKLPPERVLAADLGCSRETLRACLAVLQAEGLLWRHVGQGTFTGPRPGHIPVREALLIEAASPRDLMQARLLLEPQVAAEAAARATVADITHLRKLVEAGRRGRDRMACEAADDAFHSGIARVAGNPVLIGFLGFLSGARRRVAWQRQWEQTYRRIGIAEFQGLHSDQHSAVLDAMAVGDADGAAQAMRAHLQSVAEAMGGGSCEG